MSNSRTSAQAMQRSTTELHPLTTGSGRMSRTSILRVKVECPTIGRYRIKLAGSFRLERKNSALTVRSRTICVAAITSQSRRPQGFLSGAFCTAIVCFGVSVERSTATRSVITLRLRWGKTESRCGCLCHLFKYRIRVSSLCQAFSQKLSKASKRRDGEPPVTVVLHSVDALECGGIERL